MIKQMTLALLSMLMIFVAFSQERKDLTISTSGGKLACPYYYNNTSGIFYSFDFDYSFSKRHSLLINYTGGSHNYYDNVLSTDPSYHTSDGTNAKASYHTFSFLYQYRFLNSQTFSGAIGAGAGIMTHSNLYPILTRNGSSFQQSVWTNLVFPVRFSVDYLLPKNLKLGLMGGFYIQPDFPILAYHFGPRLSYVIK